MDNGDKTSSLNPLGGESSSATSRKPSSGRSLKTCLNPLGGESSSATPVPFLISLQVCGSQSPWRGIVLCDATLTFRPVARRYSSLSVSIPFAGNRPLRLCFAYVIYSAPSLCLNPLGGESSSATASNFAIESRCFKGFGRGFFRNTGLCSKRAWICEVCRLSIRFVVVAGHHIPPKTQRRPLADLHHLAEPEQRP